MAMPPMRFSLETIVHPDMHVVAKQLECSVCLGMVVDPVQTIACGHIFCEDCLRPCSVCPICREPMAAGDWKPLREVNKPMMRMMHGLRVRCPHLTQSQAPAEAAEPEAKRLRVDRCEWEGTYSDLLAKHLSECLYHVVPCPRSCGESMRRMDLEAHAEVCTKTFEKCSICEELLRPGRMEAHRREKAELHVQLLEAKLQERDAMAGQELVLADIRTRLTHMEAAMRNNAKTQHVTNIAKQRAEEVIQRMRPHDGCFWKVPDADRLERQFPKGSFLRSPKFSVRGMSLNMKLYPCGCHHSPQGKCGLFLEVDDLPTRVRFELSVNGVSHEFTAEKSIWGSYKYWALPSSNSDQDGTVRIAVKVIENMQIVEHTW